MNSQLRILMIAPTPYFSDRGCHVRIYEEAKALKARGHDVIVVTYHLGRNLDEIPVVRIPNIPWYRKLSAGPSWHKPYLDILLLYKSLVTAKQFSPDVVHAHLHEGAFLAVLSKSSFKVPIVFDCQGSLTGELLDHHFMRNGGLLHRLFEKLEAWITRKVDYVVTSSTPTATLIQEQFPEVANRLLPLIDAVDTEYFKPRIKDALLLRKLGVPSNKKIIVYLGAMTEYQGVDLMLDMLKILDRQRDDFHALVMGYPEAAYVNKAKKMGLEKCITFTGKVKYADSPLYLSQGDIAVSPKLSTTEANGKVLNYMACGLPCVVFDSEINRELLADSGVYVSEKSAAAFAEKVRLLLDNATKCEQLANTSRKRAEIYHSWHARIKDLETVYMRLQKSLHTS